MPNEKITSKKLPSSILNYFAAFTETKFNFRTLINYRWTNDELTLDLSLFQNFQKKLLEIIKSEKNKSIVIKSNEFTLSLLGDDIQIEIEKALSNAFGQDYLKTCVEQKLDRIIEQDKILIASDEGAQHSDTSEHPEVDEEKQRGKAFREGTRKYNRAIRKQLENILIELQDKKIDQLKEELGIENVPASIFNTTNYLKKHFDALQLLARDCETIEEYFDKVTQYFNESIEDIILYDLFINIQKYARFNITGTQYLFFHELNKKGENSTSESYPIFFIEADFVLGHDEITISFPRNLVLINTPAVNYFRFPSVLTTPRSSTFQNAAIDLGGIEVFLQAQYGWTEPFVLETHFKQIYGPKDIYPDIKCRIGFQVVQKENKKLLDYSEIMTHISSGGKSKFSDFISDYIDGNVENTQDHVDKEYREKYPIKSPQRYISENPLNLNNSQKRILLALNNQKNKIIVVDGPPGTGKSHTIAALTYWANQENKSVVITSHKKEALDVIDRMLTEKFCNLHPKAKPSIVRFGKNGKSINTLENTLQNAVINAAGDRTNEYNEQATAKDVETRKTDLIEKLEKQLSFSDEYEQSIKDLFEFEKTQNELVAAEILTEAETELPRVPESTKIDFDKIFQFASEEIISSLKNINLPEFNFLLKHKKDIPIFINACEEINQHAGKGFEADIDTSEIPETLIELIEQCFNLFKKNIPIDSIKTSDITGAFLKKLFRKIPEEKEIENLIKSLKSLKHVNIIKDIARIKDISRNELTLDDVSTGIGELRVAISLKKHQNIINEYRSIDSNSEKNIPAIYQTLSGVKDSLDKFSVELFNSITEMFNIYETVLSRLGISSENLDSLFRLKELTGTELKIWEWIRLHYKLSKVSVLDSISKDDLDSYYALKQKEIEHLNDVRLKNLNNFLGDIAKIKVSFDGGKRLTSEQVRVLLNNVSGLIAEPDMISKFFPMNEDMIDLLIIDEASQVSIANSISLILRAKQVVIFGDEYQYGAVSAVNVSSKYSASYFKEIINAYSGDYNVSATQQETDSLITEVSREIDDEDLEVDKVLRPQDNAGTILWLKTFNIRTSTLNFAKAIANYTTSLREHYRSFPEIIDYSNDFFYKPAQLELIINRIRTKPIGEVLQFIEVETKGNSGRNVNFDEIDAIIGDLKTRIENGYKGSIGIITSFREQQARMEQALNEQMNMPELKRNHKMAIWFVGDVQGEERDLVYYSFVEDKKYGNADLRSIYPVIDGTADTTRSLKMQRLNVGFSRAKDTMVFVHSMPVNDYSHTRLGDALKHYKKLLDENSKNDFFVEDIAVFGSPAEENLYNLLINTDLVKSNREHIKIVPQFKIGEYIRAEFERQIPKYRVDFLMTFSREGKEKSLILEYDGVEFHTKNPDMVTGHNFTQEYLDYDVNRQIELESYGYRFLRLNKFNLRPEQDGETKADVLDRFLKRAFAVE